MTYKNYAYYGTFLSPFLINFSKPVRTPLSSKKMIMVPKIAVNALLKWVQLILFWNSITVRTLLYLRNDSRRIFSMDITCINRSMIFTVCVICVLRLNG